MIKNILNLGIFKWITVKITYKVYIILYWMIDQTYSPHFLALIMHIVDLT